MEDPSELFNGKRSELLTENGLGETQTRFGKTIIRPFAKNSENNVLSKVDEIDGKIDNDSIRSNLNPHDSHVNMMDPHSNLTTPANETTFF